jgi:hypothetical protein
VGQFCFQRVSNLQQTDNTLFKSSVATDDFGLIWKRVWSESEKSFNSAMNIGSERDVKKAKVVKHNMKNNLKMAAVAVALMLAFSIVAFVYAATQDSVALTDTQNVNTAELRTLILSDNQTYPNNQTGPWQLYGPCASGHDRRMMGGLGGGLGGGPGFGQFLSENSTPATAEGTVVAQTGDILVLSTNSGQVRVMIPKDWTVSSEVVSRADLFNGTFASQGQNVTLSVLKSEMFSNTSFSINSMLAYQATNASGTVAYAVLPFNIQPAS